MTIVIPTRDNERTIAACVTSARHQDGDVEVIVVDNHSRDATSHLARQHGADRVLLAGPERSAQRNRGLEASTGEFVVFIDSDMVLDDGLAGQVRAAFSDERIGAVVLPERSFGDGYLAACRSLEKRLYLDVESAEAARAFRVVALDSVGGYDEALVAFEDYELHDRVRASGWRLGRTGAGLQHDEGRVDLRTLWRKKRYYGSQWGLVAGGGLSRHRLRRLPRRPQLLLTDLVHVPGLVLLKTVDVVGVVAGHRTARRSRMAAVTALPPSHTGARHE